MLITLQKALFNHLSQILNEYNNHNNNNNNNKDEINLYINHSYESKLPAVYLKDLEIENLKESNLHHTSFTIEIQTTHNQQKQCLAISQMLKDNITAQDKIKNLQQNLIAENKIHISKPFIHNILVTQDTKNNHRICKMQCEFHLDY